MPDKSNWWNKKDDTYLLKNYETMSYRKLSDNLGRSEHGIRNRLKILGARAKRHFAPWTKGDDILLRELYNNRITIKEMISVLGRSEASIRLRANIKLNAFRNDRLLKLDIPEQNFYYNLKRILIAKNAGSRCCICGYSKHIDLHHKDGNRKNHHRSNIASLCPNCHREVEAGDHLEKELKCIWWRTYSDGTISEIKEV